jgi:heme-degrading monooxygenase HmoA
MILEVADIRIPPGKNAEFEVAIGQGLATVIAPRAKGYIAHKVQRGIESPERYLLMIWWQALENHTVDFRQGPLFAEWRSFIGPFLALPPQVEHFELALESGWPR